MVLPIALAGLAGLSGGLILGKDRPKHEYSYEYSPETITTTYKIDKKTLKYAPMSVYAPVLTLSSPGARVESAPLQAPQEELSESYEFTPKIESKRIKSEKESVGIDTTIAIAGAILLGLWVVSKK